MSMSIIPKPRGHNRRILLIWICVSILAVSGILLAITRPWESDCDNWADEMIAAIEDGSLQDGSFQSTEACREQFRKDLERLSR